LNFSAEEVKKMAVKSTAIYQVVSAFHNDSKVRERVLTGPAFPLKKEEWFLFHPDFGFGNPPESSGILDNLRIPSKEAVSSRRLVLEIGYGGAEYIKNRALTSPDDLFIGIDKDKIMYLRALHRLKRVGNVILFNENALEVLPMLFYPSSVDEVVINFPDPWPKRRHSKHRLFQWVLIEDLKWIMAPGATLKLASDQEDYISYAASLLFGDFSDYFSPVFPIYYLENPQFEIGTRYEKKWKQEGRSVYYIEAIKI